MITATDKQLEVLSVIKKFKEDHGYSPTVRELSSELNKSIGCAFDYIKALKRKGYINYGAGISRSIVIKRLPEDG